MQILASLVGPATAAVLRRAVVGVVAEGGQLGDGDVVLGGEGLHPLRPHQRRGEVGVHGQRHHLRGARDKRNQHSE